MTNLAADLTARWRPSYTQLADVEQAFAAAAGAGVRQAVFTAHILVNKHYGIWYTDVEVVAVPGVFADRDAASAAAVAAAEKAHTETGLPVTGGWTRHTTPDSWAVFEDILAVFPKGSA